MQASLSLILQFTSCEAFQREKSFLIMQFDVVLDFEIELNEKMR